VENIFEKLKCRLVLLVLGVTKLIGSSRRSVPGKWQNLADSICVSCQSVHIKLIEADEEAAKDFCSLEESVKRRVGKEKFLF
jgi:hypothetical protein